MKEKSKAARGLGIFLAASIVVSQTAGCTAVPGGFASDRSDVCQAERQDLAATGDYFSQDIIQGAVTGAVGGGIIGAIARGDARGVLYGAAAGGVVGALGGYFKARQQQYANSTMLYQSIAGDIHRDNDGIDRTQFALNRLVDCRKRQADGIRADLATNRISRAEAANQMAAVRSRYIEDVRVARTIANKVQTRSADFEFANNQVNPNAPLASNTSTAPAQPQKPAPRATASAQPSRRDSAQTHQPAPPAPDVLSETSTNVAKRDQLQATVTNAENNQSAFELS